jgi:hypothetical protein
VFIVNNKQSTQMNIEKSYNLYITMFFIFIYNFFLECHC